MPLLPGQCGHKWMEFGARQILGKFIMWISTGLNMVDVDDQVTIQISPAGSLTH